MSSVFCWFVHNIHKLLLSGKVLDGGPCTPFDPAPLGLALHEAQGEELVSTPVFITAGLNENNKN